MHCLSLVNNTAPKLINSHGDLQFDAVVQLCRYGTYGTYVLLGGGREIALQLIWVSTGSNAAGHKFRPVIRLKHKSKCVEHINR